MLSVKATARTIAVSYALLYLFLIGDIDIGGSSWRWMILPIDSMQPFSQRSLLHFEAVAMVELGWFTVLLSPVNTIIALTLGMLLALNVYGVISMRTQACQLSKSTSSMSALPALLTGGACCAPSLFLVLGIPGLGALIGYIGWLLPLSALLLLVNRFWQRAQGAPAWRDL
ncbi:MAG: hypothetical protein P1P93_03385 [Gammaproteobacteria bacterium]|nr:hypothetical protein [Gammaproteobacteria bacterium]MDT8371285.1 hypothetical protein [Gammaproteobacteria bacterium]